KDGVGFLVGGHCAALELDRFEAKLAAHGLGLGYNAVRVERGLLARRGPSGGVGVGLKAQSAACAFVLIEEVGGEVHAFAHAAAEQVTDRAAYRLAHDVKTGDFDGAKDVREPS